MRVVNGSQVPPEAGPVYSVAVPLAAAEGRSGTFVIDLVSRGGDSVILTGPTESTESSAVA